MSTDLTTLLADALQRQLDDATTQLCTALDAKQAADATYGPLAEEAYRRAILEHYPTAVRVELDPDDFDNGRFLVVTGIYDTDGKEIANGGDMRDIVDVDEMEADLTALHGTVSHYALQLQPAGR